MAEIIQARILLIESDELSANIFKKAIEPSGHQIDVATCGADGLALYNASHYDAVTINSRLADMTAVDVARQLLHHDPGLAITLITEPGNEAMIAEALSHGVLNYATRDPLGNYAELLPSLMSQSLHMGSNDDRGVGAILGLDRRRLADAARLAKLGFWIWDEIEDRCIYCSEELANIHGITVSEYLDRASSYDGGVGLVHPDDKAAYDGLVDGTIARENGYEVEFRVIASDGTVKHVIERAEAETHVDGRLTRSFGTIQDITQLVEAEEELYETQLNYRWAAEIGKLGHYVWDEINDVCEHCSDEMARLLNMTAEEYLDGAQDFDQFLLHLIHPGDQKRYTRYIQESDKNGTDIDIVYRTVHPGGETRYMHEFGRRVHDKDGRLIRTLGILRDVTDEKTAEKAVLAARNEAESANRLKSDFLAHMSHELRTPLNAITGFSQLMEGQIFGDLGHAKYLEYAADINRSGQFLLNIINDILDLSKIEADQITLFEETFDVESVIAACVHMIVGHSTDQSRRIRTELPGIMAQLHADERIFSQIMLNLLSNADKFTPDDGEISVTVEYDDDSTTKIKVADTGRGIDPADISKALEPFGQIKSDSHLAHKGTGLGLPLCQKLMELHGGTLGLESEIGVGTTVTLVFPPERTMPHT